MVRVIRGLVLLLAAAGTAGAQTGPPPTPFTYQGRLTIATEPANGTYDFRFTLFRESSGGDPLAASVEVEDVNVTEGLFTVSLDFGLAPFDESPLWLEIAFRPGDSVGDYDVLSPRQELTATPKALFSYQAPWKGITGKPPGFEDGTDDDTLGALHCDEGRIIRRIGSAWVCSYDVGIASVTVSGR